MNRLSEGPSQRAWAIAAGLVRTRRAAKYEPTEGFIRAEGVGATRYWISDDGARLLRGKIVASADELQPGFIEAMARAGRER
jgi:hypothetical protein